MTEVSRNLRNIFLVKKPPILEIEVGFFSHKKSFRNFLTSYRELTAHELIMNKVSRKLRNIFLAKIPPILKLEVRFLST